MTQINENPPTKYVVFVRNGVERILRIRPTMTEEKLRDTIVASFGLPQESRPAIMDIRTSVVLSDLTVAEILADPDNSVRYRVMFGDDERHSGYWIWHRFVLPFLSKSFSYMNSNLERRVADLMSQ